MTRVLIVDDEPPIRVALERILVQMGCEVVTAQDGMQARDRLAASTLDLVITDLSMPNADGFEVLRAVRELYTGLPVIVLTGHGTTADCVRAMRAGAIDFIAKPFNPDALQQAVRTALGNRADLTQAALLGDSPQMQAVIDQVERIAPNDVAVVLVGERDTGKNAVVRLLHTMSPRAGKPLVTFRCGFESIDLASAFASAESGTLVVTDLEALPEATRGRVASEIAQRAVLGGSGDVRVLVSIDLDADNDIDASSFAASLQAMVDGVMIAMPPLRERLQDVPLLVEHFTDVANWRLGRNVSSTSLITALQSYSWPGNLGELEERISKYVSEAPPDFQEEVLMHANAFVVPVDRVSATLVLSDGTRRDAVLPRGPGQPIEELFEAREPFVAVKESSGSRIYARAALACVSVREPAIPEDDALPHKQRTVRVTLRSGVTLEGELRYVAVEGRGRVTDVLNESAPSFALRGRDTAHHIAKVHVLCIEEL